MPPKRSSTRKRGRAVNSTPPTDDGPSMRRSRRSSTRNSTLASQAATIAQPQHDVIAQPQLDVIAQPQHDVQLASPPHSAVRLTPDLMQSIVSTVTAEVTKQLAAQQHQEVTQPLPPSQTSERHTVSVVNDAINAAHSRIMGEPQLLPTSTVVTSVVPTQVFLSSSLPIDSRISAKLREKNCNEEYVDFAILLSNPVHDKYQISFQNSGAGVPASLCLEPVSKPKKILNIEAWQQAFYIFVGIYSQKHPHEAPALMKYGQTIRDLAARGQNWLFYDENFRYLRQTQIGHLPWGAIHGGLWLRSQYAPKATPSVQNKGSPKSRLPSIPSGFCFKFHHGQFCPGKCGFHHTCFKCKGPHRHTQCTCRPPANKHVTSDRPAKSTSNASKTPTSG